MKETIVLGLLGLLMILLLIEIAISPTLDDVVWCEDTHIVRHGETLWSISKLYCPDSVDRREWIDEIKQLNNIGDTIYEGEEIIVLVEVTE
ncbi:MAG: LysM peptidoglycan-binding domain-containing protein [Clostridia bacterium]|nr:LysM peptidoglycan-binding domain-containing protein [Clostridia bacterium]